MAYVSPVLKLWAMIALTSVKQAEVEHPEPFSDAFGLTDALFWDRRRPRLHASWVERPSVAGQARTPAVSEERSISSKASLKGSADHY